MLKKISALLLCIMVLTSVFSPINVFAETSKIDIVDNADFFTESEEEALEDYIKSLIYDDLGMDVVVLTEPFDPDDEVVYTDDYYDNNNYGKDGVLFFVSNGVYYINTNGYAITAISDDEVENILDAGWDGFDNYDFYDCVYDMIGKAGYYIEYAYNNGYVDDKQDTDIEPVVPHVPNTPSKSEQIVKAIIPTLGSLLVSLLITGITVAVLLLKHKGISKAENAKTYLNNTFKVNNMNTRYVGSRETVQRDYYKPSSSSSSGGSRSNGHSSGSSHRSSSGRSHGGGGRRR
jgi:uncharacterized protein